MKETSVEKFTKNPIARQTFAFETLKLAISEALCEIMNNNNLSVEQVAQITDWNEQDIQKIIDDECNFQLHNLADLFSSLGYILDIKTYKQWLK